MHLYKFLRFQHLLVVTTTVNQDWINSVSSYEYNLVCINAGITNFPTNIPNNLHVLKLPLSFLPFKAYSFLSKLQVLVVEFEEFIICFIVLLWKRRSKVVFSSSLNCRPLYILSLFFDKRISVKDVQNKYVYNFMHSLNGKHRLCFDYGNFVFRRLYQLPKYPEFIFSSNDYLYQSIVFRQKAPILIIHNPLRWNYNRSSIISCINKFNPPSFYLLVHPKTSVSEKEELKKYLISTTLIKCEIVSIQDMISCPGQNITFLSRVITLNSTLDFIFFEKSIPVCCATPLSKYDV